MNCKLAMGLVVAAAAVIALGASPIFAAHSLIDAARRGDSAALERKVDFPALRESLKDELNAELRREMRERVAAEDSGLAGLGMMLAPTLVAGAVDSLVTPDGVAAMVQTARAPRPETAGERPREPENRDGRRIRQSYGYRDLNTFVVKLTDDGHPDRSLSLLMERRNLVGWKLAGVDLNDEG